MRSLNHVPIALIDISLGRLASNKNISKSQVSSSSDSENFVCSDSELDDTYKEFLIESEKLDIAHKKFDGRLSKTHIGPLTRAMSRRIQEKEGSPNTLLL